MVLCVEECVQEFLLGALQTERTRSDGRTELWPRPPFIVAAVSRSQPREKQCVIGGVNTTCSLEAAAPRAALVRLNAKRNDFRHGKAGVSGARLTLAHDEGGEPVLLVRFTKKSRLLLIFHCQIMC